MNEDDDQDNLGEVEETPNNAKLARVPDDDPAHALVRELVAAHHDELAGLEIALVWLLSVKPDRDDHLVWGKARKVSDLERQLGVAADFVVCLNKKVWDELPDHSRRALLDHELSHCGLYEAPDGEARLYVRKHDLEEFVAVARRHGLWRAEVEALVNAALGKDREPSTPLFDQKTPAPAAARKTIGGGS